jgi:hypothetical protein
VVWFPVLVATPPDRVQQQGAATNDTRYGGNHQPVTIMLDRLRLACTQFPTLPAGSYSKDAARLLSTQCDAVCRCKQTMVIDGHKPCNVGRSDLQPDQLGPSRTSMMCQLQQTEPPDDSLLPALC